MKYALLLTAALACAPALTYAAPPDSLMEGCNSIPNAAKRLQCFKDLMAQPSAAAAPAPLSRDYIKPLRDRYLDFDVATNTGISLNDFRSSIVGLSQEYARYKAAHTAPPEADAKISQAIEDFQNAARFWEASIRFFVRSDNKLAYAGGLPVDMTGMRGIAEQYNLPLRKADILGLHAGVNPDEGRSAIISAGKANFQDGLELLAR